MRSLQFEIFKPAPFVPVSTSYEATQLIERDAGQLRTKVFCFLQTHGPATDEEMQEKIPMCPNTQRPRRRELQLRGLISETGQFRKTKSGRKAIVWRAAA